MSDWKFLNEHRCKDESCRFPKRFWTTDADGFNGAFKFMLDGRFLLCIVSDGEGWQHVSVSEERSQKPLPWDIMCRVKDLFWKPDDWVIQFHPAEKDYVNMHKGCLHLWRPTGQTFPVPPKWMVGI